MEVINISTLARGGVEPPRLTHWVMSPARYQLLTPHYIKISFYVLSFILFVRMIWWLLHFVKKLIKLTLQLFVGVEGIEPTCNRLPFLLCIRQRGYAPSLYVSPYCHQSRMHAVLSPFGSAYPNPKLT